MTESLVGLMRKSQGGRKDSDVSHSSRFPFLFVALFPSFCLPGLLCPPLCPVSLSLSLFLPCVFDPLCRPGCRQQTPGLGAGARNELSLEPDPAARSRMGPRVPLSVSTLRGHAWSCRQCREPWAWFQKTWAPVTCHILASSHPRQWPEPLASVPIKWNH